MPSDTPRTDAESPHLWVVPAQFAKQLERELAAMRQQRDEARREACHLEAVRSSFLGFQKNIKDHAAQRGWDCFKEGGGA